MSKLLIFESVGREYVFTLFSEKSKPTEKIDRSKNNSLLNLKN